MKKIFLFICLSAICWVPMNASVVKLGDANMDGDVDISDVTALIDYVLKGVWTNGNDTDWLNRGDMDLNGEVDISDVTALINYVLKGIWQGAPTNETFSVNGVSFKMIAVEGGTFLMGGTYSSFEKPIHQVSLSSFAIGETEVTQALWEAVMGGLPSIITDVNKNPQYPVVCVNWNAVQEFITNLNEMTGLTFRLLTEAEWEYAARGGNKSIDYAYSGSNNLDEVAWYYSNSDNHLHQVACLRPNELGVYDMTGNAAEWCNDYFANYYYSNSPSINPQGPETGGARVHRGGFYTCNTSNCRLSGRWSCSQTGNEQYLGFRLAL